MDEVTLDFRMAYLGQDDSKILSHGTGESHLHTV